MVTDPVADFINRIKTAQMAGLPSVSLPFSKLKFEIAELLAREGYLESASKRGKKVKKYIDLTLKYNSGKPEVRGVTRLSKPSKRVYIKSSEIKPIKFGHGMLVVSTPKGLLTGNEARKEKVGGEALFSIW
jgi:small subunit ribosomal protein S8